MFILYWFSFNKIEYAQLWLQNVRKSNNGNFSINKNFHMEISGLCYCKLNLVYFDKFEIN